MLFSVLMLPLLISLGLWQLQRAQEKATIQETWRAQQALAAVPLQDLVDVPELNFRRVSIRGEFDAEHYWLLENRILDGQLGYEVLMPFRLDADSAAAGITVVLVNRGWVPAGAYRDQLPEVHTPAGPLTLSGSLVEPSDNQFITEVATPASHWPRKILEVDLDSLSTSLGEIGYASDIYKRVLRIDAENIAALQVHWQPVNMTASKHQGYAVQWFSMAVALLILTLFANSNIAELLFSRKRKSDGHE